jgi:hypothetical protein
MEREQRPIYLATLTVDTATIEAKYPSFIADRATATIFRSVLMKPEQRGYVGELFREIEAMVACK